MLTMPVDSNLIFLLKNFIMIFFQFLYEGLSVDNYKELICFQLYAEEHRLEEQIVDYDMVNYK